jgi:hypothetical protein
VKDDQKGDLIAWHGERSVSFWLDESVSVCISVNALYKRRGLGEKEDWIEEASSCATLVAS